MTKRTALVLLVLAMSAALGVRAVLANDRGLSDAKVIEKLNGSPRPIGWIYSRDAGSINNCTSPLWDGGVQTPFDAGYGDLVLTVCNQDFFLKAGDCSTVATHTDLPVAAGEKFYRFLGSKQMAIAGRPQDGGISGGCGFWRME